MRTFGAVVMATLVFASSNIANASGALAPGKPAGVHAAALQDNTLWVVLGGSLLIGGIVLASTGNDHNEITPAATTTTTTTTATTTTATTT